MDHVIERSPKPRAIDWVQAFRSPAVVFYAAAYLLAASYLLARGQVPLASFAFAATMVVFCAVTFWLTRGVPPLAVESSRGPQKRMLAQAAAVLFFILINSYTALVAFRVIPSNYALVPIWSPLTSLLTQAGERLGGGWGAMLFGHPLRYFILPLIVLLVLGARFRTLGFEQGYRAWAVIALWCGIEVAVWCIQLVTGSLTIVSLAGRVMSNALQNGFFEEFLFRGALQTRLAALLTPGWALVLQSLVFAAWHLGLDTQAQGGDLLAGLAFAIIYHSVLGLALGIIFMRTRNLLAGSLFHIAFNSFG